jgi:Fatty acid cis/trans isomerase (CTI)
VASIEGLRNEADYSALLDRFGIRRSDERFWAVSDQVSADYRNSEALSHGVLDYSRYENR